MCRRLSDTAFSTIARTSRFTADTATLPESRKTSATMAPVLSPRRSSSEADVRPRMWRSDRLLSRKLLRQSLNAYQVTPDRTFVPGLSRFNFTPWNFYQRPDKQYTAGGFANFDFFEAAQAYAEVMAMKDRSLAGRSVGRLHQHRDDQLRQSAAVRSAAVADLQDRQFRRRDSDPRRPRQLVMVHRLAGTIRRSGNGQRHFRAWFRSPGAMSKAVQYRTT